VLPSGARNEALDGFVYAYAAALRLGLTRANWEKLEAAVAPCAEGQPKALSPPPPRRAPIRSNWLGRFR
jgi:phage terminase large subunit GpA-like protein